MLVLITQVTNYKKQVMPKLWRVLALPASLNQPEQFLAENGYFNVDNVTACGQGDIEPLIAVKRHHHHPAIPNSAVSGQLNACAGLKKVSMNRFWVRKAPWIWYLGIRAVA